MCEKVGVGMQMKLMCVHVCQRACLAGLAFIMFQCRAAHAKAAQSAEKFLRSTSSVDPKSFEKCVELYE